MKINNFLKNQFFLCFATKLPQIKIYQKNNYTLLCLLLLVFISSCTKNTENIIPNRTITQIGKFELLNNGKLYGIELESKIVPMYGNFGLGALSKLKGENIIIDGKNYYFGPLSSGLVSSTDSVPFLVVCNFEVDFVYNFNSSLSYTQLKKKIDSLLPDTTNKIYAVRIEGIFDSINYRKPPDISSYFPPFPILSNILKNQLVFNIYNTTSSLIGYRFPQKYTGVNIPGFHFHNIDNTFTKGGHVLAAYSNNIKVSIGTYSDLNILKY